MSVEDVLIREATEEDIPGIRDVFLAVYGADYPYQDFYDQGWLKHTIYNDHILSLVAVDTETEQILGTASVVFDIGAHSDLIAELGRLAVLPSTRGRGVGKKLMRGRIERIENRLHVAFVENRCVHPFSQKISASHGFAPVGFLPMKIPFGHGDQATRESVSLYARHFLGALDLRCNNPRIVPEAHALAHLALDNCGMPSDVVVDDESPAYPRDERFTVDELTVEGLPTLLRIERGRTRRREVFGPMRLQYGFFKLRARCATYLLARQPGGGAIAGAVGYIRDDHEKIVRIFELIAREDGAIGLLLSDLLARCEDWGIAYVEADVSAHAPRMQRTLVERGFLPVAYVPAMVFHEVERLDVIKMVRLLVPFDIGEVQLIPQSQAVADLVISAFGHRDVRPRIARAINRMSLFEGLNEEQAMQLACACSVREFEQGQTVFEQGDAPDGLYLVIEGRIGVSIGDPARLVGEVGRGEPLGEISLLTGEARSASGKALTNVVAGVLGSQDLELLTRRRPDIAVVVYRNLAIGLGRKLQRTDASLERE